MSNILPAIEEKYPVHKITVNGQQVWSYLRMRYYWEWIHLRSTEAGENVPIGSSAPLQRFSSLRRALHDFQYFFRKYDCVFLSNTTSNRIDYRGRYYNRFLDPIADELGQEHVLCLENPYPTLPPTQPAYTKHVASLQAAELAAVPYRLLARATRKKYSIQGVELLEDIQAEYGLRFDYARRVKVFESKVAAFSLLFRRLRPKALVLTCYYNDPFPAAITAAKRLGIKVVEVQHGMIGREHPAYNFGARLDRTCFPDYLLVFGERESATFADSRFIDPQNVIPVGSFYIDHMRKRCQQDPAVVERLRRYRRVVGVTLQWTVENRLIRFIFEAAKLDRTVLYVLIPRLPAQRDYSALDLPGNVTVSTEKGFYEMMGYVDFHSTVYSTCALEAPSLGVQNIMVNIDNQSQENYGHMLLDDRVTRYVDTPAQLVEAVNSFNRLPREEVVNLNKDIIATDYAANIKRFVAEHLR